MTAARRKARQVPRRILAAFAFALLGSVPVFGKNLVAPLVLFWTNHPDSLSGLTYVTPAPPIAAADHASKGEGAVRPPMHLRSRDGKVIAAEMSAAELADYWGSAAGEGYGGIAIDEFGHRDEAINAKMAKALALTDERYPHLFIAVWHAGPLIPELARAYREHADLVVLETYVSGSDDLAQYFEQKLSDARAAGILGRTVFGLGINDADARVGRTIERWANSPQELEAQMEWIRRQAPEMPGIAVFASRASLGLQRTASALAAKIFAE